VAKAFRDKNHGATSQRINEKIWQQLLTGIGISSQDRYVVQVPQSWRATREGALQETLPACSPILQSAAERTQLAAVLNGGQSTRWAQSPPTRESLV
jgi:hypothetical protein